MSATVCWGSTRNRDCILYPGKGTVVLIRPAQTFYERIILEFIQETSDSRAAATMEKYLTRETHEVLYDGLLRPYPNSKGKWFFLAWLMRDAATQRLQPLLKSVPGTTDLERKGYLLNEVRKFVAPLFPNIDNWEWAAISEVMLARLEGSRRALKGTLFEGIVRKSLLRIIQSHGLHLKVGDGQIKVEDETYDVQVVGSLGTLLIPDSLVKTRFEEVPAL